MSDSLVRSRDKLRDYLHLPSTEAARILLRPDDLIARCVERDAIAASRPAGCWCLGAGTSVYNPSSMSRFCGCAVGIEMKHQYEAQYHEQEVVKRWEASGIPARFRDFRLESSPLAKTNPALVEEVRFPPSSNLSEPSLFLWGGYGTGKTGLAIGLAWNLVQWRHIRVLFSSVPDLLSSLRSTYGRSVDVPGPTENELIGRYAGVTLLILDDIGAEHIKNTGWVEDRLYQIIGRRHAEKRTTFFTSNLSPDALGAKIGERIVWRIIEMCGPTRIIEVKGPNLRDTKYAGP